jgi:cytochrome P450
MLIVLSFIVGHRSCIGKKFAKIEAVLVLAHIIKNYQVKLADPDAELELEVVVTLRPVNPLRIIFEKRK